MVKGTTIDHNKLAKVTRGDVARSVVATGKIQPITKVEVKSKASGIVEKLYVDINYVGEEGPATGTVGPGRDSGAGGSAARSTGFSRGERVHFGGQYRAGQGECGSAGSADVQSDARSQS